MIYNDRVMRRMLEIPEIYDAWEKRPKSDDLGATHLKKMFWNLVEPSPSLSWEYQRLYDELIEPIYDSIHSRKVGLLVEELGWTAFHEGLLQTIKNERILAQQCRSPEEGKLLKLEEKIASMTKRLVISNRLRPKVSL